MKQKPADQRIKIGRLGEQLAADYLRQKQYHILEQNWRCRSGELDIIAIHDQTLIFIEVRTRKNSGQFGSAAESVNDLKQQKLRKTAQVYLHQHSKHDAQVRFDVITVLLDDQESVMDIEHIRNAF